MAKFLPALIAGLVWIAAGSLALADAPALPGKAVGVDTSAVANFNGNSRTLIVGSDISMGETVVTDTSGTVQLLFSDNTRLLVGPNSSLLIEAYLLRSDNSLSRFAVDALAGSFRFITGDGPKPAYRIDTPTGMIGVRGTEFDFNVDPELGTTLVLFEGAVRMCNLDNKCIDLTKGCAVGRMAASGSSSIAPAQQTSENLRAKFPYVQSEDGLLPAFKSADSADCLKPVQPKAVVNVTPPIATSPPPTPPAPPRIRPRPSRGRHLPPLVTPPSPPVITIRPPRFPHRPPHRTYDPCADYAQMSRAERLALRRSGIFCAGGYPPPRSVDPDSGPPPSLIGNPFPIPPRRPPRRGTTDGNDNGVVLY